MNKFIRELKLRRIMRLLNRFRRTAVAEEFIRGYLLDRALYGVDEAENNLLEVGYNSMYRLIRLGIKLRI